MIKNPSMLQGHHRHRKGKGGKASDDDDDDDFPKIHFHFHTPSYAPFKMDEGATILHTLLQKLGDPSYLQFAARVATNHTLASPKQAKVNSRLRATLSNLQAGGADFLLAAAGADFP